MKRTIGNNIKYGVFRLRITHDVARGMRKIKRKLRHEDLSQAGEIWFSVNEQAYIYHYHVQTALIKKLRKKGFNATNYPGAWIRIFW